MGINSLDTGLCLPALDIMALLQGRMIVALSQTFRNPLQFLLCPIESDESSLQLAERYRPSFLRGLPEARVKPKSAVMTARAWAQLGTCRIYYKSHDLEALSQLTVWTPGYLQELVQMQHKLFLMSLQVYRFERPVHLPMQPLSSDRVGQYVQLPAPISNRDSLPVVNQGAFTSRQRQLFDLSPPPHPELESLQSELVKVRESGLGGMSLDRDLRYFLGWSRLEETQLYDSDLVWIRKISELSRMGKEAGFTQVASQGLEKLGFCHQRDDISVLLRAERGLQAADSATSSPVINCIAPYRLIGECLINPAEAMFDGAIERLQQLGQTCLSEFEFEQAIKVIFSAHPLSVSAETTAITNGVNIMRPETLQRLTELQSQHPGSIDLLKLKPCLQAAPFGENADGKVNQFVDDILQELAVRAALIRAVKDCLHNTGEGSVGTDAVFFLYTARAEQLQLPQLNRIEVQETLIELSSPLAGYLGRVDDLEALANRRSHRFYFLRELHIEHSSLALKIH